MAEVHNEKLRMPAVLREEDHAAWLTGSREQAMQALKPYPSHFHGGLAGKSPAVREQGAG